MTAAPEPGEPAPGESPLVLPDRLAVPDAPELEVRAWRLADAPALAQAIGESAEHLRPWMPWIAREPLPLAEREAMIQRWADDRRSGGDAVLGILRAGDVLGGIGAHRRIGPDGLEIGYWLRADEEGRSTMTAVVGALTQALLALPGITHVEIRNDQGNPRSGAVARRCGYRLVGTADKPPEAPAESGTMQVWRIGADPT